MRELFLRLSDDSRERARYELKQSALADELKFLGIPDCPVALSKDASISMSSRVSAFWRDVVEWGRQEQVESLPRQQNIQEDKPGVGRRPTPMAMGYSLETYRRAPPLLFTKGKS